VDNTQSYKSAWAKEVTKNISDYTISNLFNKGKSLVQSENEDEMLRYASQNNYKHAVVFSTGTEFVNGDNFFNEVDKLIETDYFLYGHILDRKTEYYELHHQCYLINIEKYTLLGQPIIGDVTLGNPLTTTMPVRSEENIHDDYTPLWIKSGSVTTKYNHRLHGWNIINCALENRHTINAWPESIRQHKMYYYPENITLFNERINDIYKKYNYCQYEFVHTKGTDPMPKVSKFKQIVSPASDNWWKHYASEGVEIILYDYNQESINYWKTQIEDYNVKFIKCNLLTDNLLEHINDDFTTLVNLSNIFCYEGTVALHSLEHRLARENFYVDNIKNATMIITGRAAEGFGGGDCALIKDLTKPTWHIGEWNYYE
jgi:hypothetical protein